MKRLHRKRHIDDNESLIYGINFFRYLIFFAYHTFLTSYLQLLPTQSTNYVRFIFFLNLYYRQILKYNILIGNLATV